MVILFLFGVVVGVFDFEGRLGDFMGVVCVVEIELVVFVGF